MGDTDRRPGYSSLGFVATTGGRAGLSIGHRETKEGLVKRTSAIILSALLGLALGAATASAELGLKGIEGRVGLASLESDLGSTFIVSAAADMGTLVPELGFELNADFWIKSWDEDLFDVKWSDDWTNIALLANVRYMFPMEGTFHPFVFGGLGLHYFSFSSKCSNCTLVGGDESASDTSIKFGLDLGAGAEFNAGSLTPVLRVGYNTNGGPDYLFVQGGLKFPIGK
jgi:opacity protein-like surface antigen